MRAGGKDLFRANAQFELILIVFTIDLIHCITATKVNPAGDDISRCLEQREQVSSTQR
jgi:hypothetical protein